MKSILTLATALLMVVASGVEMDAMAAKKAKKGKEDVKVENENYYEYKGVEMGGRQYAGGTKGSFFDCETGTVYTTCSVAGNEEAIDFIVCDFVEQIALYSPSNAFNIIRSYRCDGVPVNESGAWNKYIDKESGTQTAARMLNSEDSRQAAVIAAFEAGTLNFTNGSINIPKPAAKASKVSPQSLPCYLYMTNQTTGKSGVIKVTALGEPTEKGRIANVTFDIIWQR